MNYFSLMVDGPWRMAQGSWLVPHASYLMANKELGAGSPQALSPRAKFVIGHEP